MQQYGFDDGRDNDRRARIVEAQYLLERLGFDKPRRNFRSAASLVVLAGLDFERPWSEARRPIFGITPLMSRVNDNFCSDPYRPNNRESFRKFTMHQFIEAGLVEHNSDSPGIAVNDSRNSYRLTAEAHDVIRAYGEPEFDNRLAEYLTLSPGLAARNAASRDVVRIPVELPDGTEVSLSPAGQNVLMKAIVEDFCPVFTPGGRVLYIGDADTKLGVFEEAILANLGVELDLHGKFPDLIVYMQDQNWLFLIEAVTSHGPIDDYRYEQLSNIFSGSTAGLVYVNCFPDRATFKKFFNVLTWESEVWLAAEPSHMIHLNGSRFLGPY